MPTIQIDALDTLFFRDSKTFTKGEDTWADTMFPPYPSVIYGALRSAYFAEDVSKLDFANTENDPTSGLIIKNICLKQGNDFYFPLPLDCVQEKGWSNTTAKKDKVFVINPNPIKSEVLSSCPVSEIVQIDNDKQIENVSDGILSKSELEKYLKANDEKELSIKKRSDYLTTEPKIGIARSQHTHTSNEGMLYRVGMNRMAKGFDNTLSLIIDFEGLDIPDKGLMKMGGEGKAIKYQDLKDQKPDFALSGEIKNKIQESRQFKLYLSTPAIFKKGWLPVDIDKNTLEGTINDVKVKLITAAIGKPISIGGWDIKKGCPKTMRKAVPAGSVYYFKLLEGDISKLHGQSISDKFPDNNYSKQGFGISYVGAVK
jgi:CRISPR-associated protein Cmr3